MADLKVVEFTKQPPRFARGDLVCLKSEPQEKKTVAEMAGPDVTCNWTSDLGEPQEATYHQDMINLWKPKPKRKPRPRVSREVVFTPEPRKKPGAKR